MTQTAVELWQELACPRDHSRLEPRGETLVCEQGHEYPYVDGIPVMVVDDEIAPTQPGYWSKPEQIERVRAAEPPPVEGEAVDPYVAELILGTHGNLYKHLSGGLTRYPIPGSATMSPASRPSGSASASFRRIAPTWTWR